MENHYPFALFALVNLDHKATDDILEESIGPYARSLWLATDNFDDAPQKEPQKSSQGTKPPIPEEFKSPWVGKQLDELVQWVQAKPEEADLNDRHFALLDTGAREDPPTIIICRVGDFKGQGDKMFLLRKRPLDAAEHLMGAAPNTWDEEVRYRGNTEIKYDDDEA